MRRSNPSTDPEDDPERGSAALEFLVVGMLLLVPLVYLIVTLGLIQGGALGVEAGARHVARAVATAVDADEARDRADLVVASVVREYGLDGSRTTVETRCRPAGATCPRAGATLVVTLRTTVALPLVPPVLGLDRLASIPVESTTVHKVSRVWGSGS
ncbi:TadE family protein [Microbacterium sp. 2FI]|uniref:TadE/TadG family type IV pilus assembly protein n=1 Tax=Microbacterium sp. 2FI TaxID=2502193 RepID=UPI0010F8176F|nr:TadE family protein [Microbacterium sp. 2FI]